MLNSREGGSRMLIEMLDDSALDFAILPINQRLKFGCLFLI